MPTNKLTTEILVAALEGFTQQRARLDSQIAELRAMLAGNAKVPAVVETAVSPRTPADGAKAKQGKRRLSAAGRRNIIEATKRRWALKRAEQAKAEGSSASKVAAKRTPAKKAAAK